MGIDNVTDVTPRVQYTAIAAQVAFDYSFQIFEDADLVVEVDGVTKALTTDYTVSGATEDTGGTVTFGTAPGAGAIVTIYRDTAVARTSDFGQNGPFLSSAINDELDQAYLIMQELESKIGRCIRFPFSSEANDDDQLIDPLSSYLSKFLRISSAGLLEPAAITDDLVTLSADTIGQLVKPKIAAETTAGVTVVDYTQDPMTPLRYGVNTVPGTTDMSDAIQACINVYKAKVSSEYVSYQGTASNVNQEHGAAIRLTPAGIYRCDSTIWLGIDADGGETFNEGAKNIVADPGFTIVSHAAGLPAIDCTGAYNLRIENLTIFGDKTNTPSVGMLLARSGTGSPNPSAGNHQFYNVRILGGFEVCCVYNYGSEINTWNFCEFRNPHAGGHACYYQSGNNSVQKFTSAFTALASDSYQSSFADKFVNCNFRYDPEPLQKITETFDGADITVGTDRITITGHSLSTGDPVTYTQGTAAVTGLTDDASYFVKKIDANTIELYSDRALASIVDITAAGAGTGHTLDRLRSAIIVLEGASYGPNFVECYFDLLQGAASSGPIVYARSMPGGSASEKRIQGMTFLACLVENDYDIFFETDTSVRELTVWGCALSATAETADIVVNAGASLLYPTIQPYKGGSVVARVTYSVAGGTSFQPLENYKTWDPTSVADGASATTTVTVTGAVLGDYAVAAFSNSLSGLVLTAYVSAADTVTVVLSNLTGAPVDLASGTLRAKVLPFLNF